MGDNDWDLFAVVRGCSTSRAVNTGAVAGSNNLPSNDFTTENSTNRGDDTLSCLASLRFEEEDEPFSFPDLLQPREGGSLDDSYKPFLPCADPTTNQGIDPFYSTSVHGAGSSGQHHQHQRLQQLLQKQPPTTSLGIRSPLTPTSIPNFTFGLQEQPQLMQQQQQQQGVQPVEVQRPASFLPLRNMQSAQAPRSRKRKNQQKKTICHVTADNLASDPWAWRKYGQKPIKGSSYPRNYYRCSSSKGCSARRQVERSHLDNNMFIVTYTGDHTHPKPTHRNSLAGSTRNKLSTTRKAARKGSAPETMPSTNASGSSPLSAASISPTTPLSAPEDANAAVHNTGDNQGEEQSVDMTLESDEDDILIPNIHIDEDLFKGLEDLVGGTIGSASTSSGLGSNPAFGANFSSWGSGNSTVAEASAGGGC